MNTSQMDRRFGLTAVQEGYITLDQLLEAIKIQITEEIEKGEHRLIGRILYEMGVITPPQIDEVLKSMDIPASELKRM